MSKFNLGQLAATRAVYEEMERCPDFHEFVASSLARYQNADWGEMSDEDKSENDRALKYKNDRIFAAYAHPDRLDWKIWIITEWDRSATTILFPDEY